MFNKLRLAAMGAIALGATACGDIDTTDSSGSSNTTTIAGTVADSYLVGTTVCLDTNENGACDITEPSTTTGADGAYILEGISTADAAAYPIVIEFSVTTVDTDPGIDTDSAGDGSDGSNTTTITGTVADGYLVGTTVCLDTNENSACDTTEPRTTTGAGGAYTLDGVSTADAVVYPIVAEVSATSVDEDTGSPVGSAYVMIAPANTGGFVSPLTTMVYITHKSTALTLDQAEDAIIKRLGFDPDSSIVSLYEDYIEASAANSGNAEHYKHIHNVARVTAATIATNYTKVTKTAGDSGTDIDILVQIIVRSVINNIDRIASSVESFTAYDGVFDDADFLEVSDFYSYSSWTTNTLANWIAEIELIESTTAETDLLAWIEKDFANVRAYYKGGMQYEYRYHSKGPNNTIEKDVYYYANSNWVQEQESDKVPFENVRLTSSGWQLVSEDKYNYALQKDGSLRLSDINTGTSMVTNASVRTKAVAGSNILSFLRRSGRRNHYKFRTNEDAQFTTGAEAYLYSFFAPDIWSIRYLPCSDQQAYTLGTGTNCSVVSSSGAPLQQLDGVMSGSHILSDSPGMIVKVIMFGTASDTSGVASFTLLNFNDFNHFGTSSSWTRTTMNGEDMIIIDIPRSVRPYTWGGSASKLFFSVYDGYVRMGKYRAGDMVTTWLFNAVAMQDLLDNF